MCRGSLFFGIQACRLVGPLSQDLVGWEGAPYPHSADPEPPSKWSQTLSVLTHPWVDSDLRSLSLLCLGSLHMGFSFPGSFPEAKASPTHGLLVASSAMSIVYGCDWSEGWLASGPGATRTRS